MKASTLMMAVLALTVAGCTDNRELSVPGETPSSGAPQFGSVNATGCSGSMASVLVPTDHVQSKLPDGFNPIQAIPGFVGVIVEGWACQSTASGGKDVGSGDWLFVYVYVEQPKNGPSDGVASRVMFEAAVNNEALRIPLQSAGFSVQAIRLTVDRTALPTAYDMQRVVVVQDDTQLYAWENSNSKTNEDGLERSRTFLASDPSTYWDSERRSSISGSAGPVAFRAEPGSVAAELIPSLTTVGLAKSIHDLSAVILAAGSHVE